LIASKLTVSPTRSAIDTNGYRVISQIMPIKMVAKAQSTQTPSKIKRKRAVTRAELGRLVTGFAPRVAIGI
jgi:hypothetical protein